MEYAENGTLEAFIKKNKKVPLETCKYMIARIIVALEKLHSHHVSHRDLKPMNILLDEKFNIKICDFGEAKVIKDLNNNAILKEYETQMHAKECEGSECECAEDDDGSEQSEDPFEGLFD